MSPVAIMSMHKNKDRKHRHRKRGIEHNCRLKLDSKHREKRFKDALERYDCLGVFATCELGSLNMVCIKCLHAGDKLRSLIFLESKILAIQISLGFMVSVMIATIQHYHPYSCKHAHSQCIIQVQG